MPLRRSADVASSSMAVALAVVVVLLLPGACHLLVYLAALFRSGKKSQK